MFDGLKGIWKAGLPVSSVHEAAGKEQVAYSFPGRFMGCAVLDWDVVVRCHACAVLVPIRGAAAS
jgi:hypothetical protein